MDIESKIEKHLRLDEQRKLGAPHARKKLSQALKRPQEFNAYKASLKEEIAKTAENSSGQYMIPAFVSMLIARSGIDFAQPELERAYNALINGDLPKSGDLQKKSDQAYFEPLKEFVSITTDIEELMWKLHDLVDRTKM